MSQIVSKSAVSSMWGLIWAALDAHYGFDPTSHVQPHTRAHTHENTQVARDYSPRADILLLKNNTDVSVIVDTLAETCPFPRFWLFLLLLDDRLQTESGSRVWDEVFRECLCDNRDFILFCVIEM